MNPESGRGAEFCLVERVNRTMRGCRHLSVLRGCLGSGVLSVMVANCLSVCGKNLATTTWMNQFKKKKRRRIKTIKTGL